AAFDFKAVRAEEVTLALNEVRSALCLTVAVEVRQRCRETDHREFANSCCCHNLTQAWVAVLHNFYEIRNNQQIGCFALGISRGHLIQEARTDDAACAPDLSNGCQRQSPTIF